MSRRQPEGSIPHERPFRFIETRATGPVVLPSAAAWESIPWNLPVTLVAEAMAQAILVADPPPAGARLKLLGLDQVVLRQSIEAGQQLEVEVQREVRFQNMARYYCRMLAAGKLAAEGRITVGF